MHSSRRASGPETTPASLHWIHDGYRHRVSAWPEAAFCREVIPGRWESEDPSPGALASAALAVGGAAWRRFLEFFPPEVRGLLQRYTHGRMAALLVTLRCPELIAELHQTPVLAGFLAAHPELRGGGAAAWAEISAVYGRDGAFGLLQWLGLPASRQTLAILRKVSEPDLPPRLLSPLRASLWEPAIRSQLTRVQALGDEDLFLACHALAA
ncbi:MAG: hypothetical protein ACO3G4_16390 [Opitutaceae bacterium]